MTSESLKNVSCLQPQGGWSAFYVKGGQYQIIPEKSLSQKTVLELINGVYVLRFDLQSYGKVYFIGLNDYLYQKFTEDRKQVRWLHEFFQAIERQLQSKGKLLGENTIFSWTLNDLWVSQGKGGNFLQMALGVFPGAVEVRK